MNIQWDQPLLIVLAILVAAFGAGRLGRVLTYDAFPPAAAARILWDRLTNDGPWAKLAHCQWCATPWIMLVCGLWAYFSSLGWHWWAFWGWLALSYLASIIIARDEPE